jgi:nitrogen regulatory protein PII
MKCIVIIYNAAIEDRVNEALGGMIEKFTIFEKVLGKGKNSQPHMGNSVWPATNKLIFSLLNNENDIDIIKERLNKIKNEYINEGLKLLVFPVEELI